MNKVQLNSLVKPLVDIYNEIEEDIIKDLLKRLSSYDDTGGTMDWLLDKLEDLGSIDKDTLKIIKGNKKEVGKVLKRMFKDIPNVHKDYMDILENYYDKGLLNVNPLSIYNSKSINRLINEALKDTTDIMKLIDTKVLEGAKESYKKILNKAYIETASGVYTYQESIRRALKEFARDGINIVHYSNGKTLGIESVVRRDVITRVNKLVGDTDLENAKDLGTNLVYVDQHLGARTRTKYMKHDYEAHSEWQGKVYMIDGSNEKYDNFVEKTGYGEMLGLKGINCYHDFRPFFEWEKVPDRIDEEENAEIYELYQKQRSYERDIRRMKREKIVAKDFYTREENTSLNNRYMALTNGYNKFLEENGLRRDYSREFIPNNSSSKLSELYNTSFNKDQFERYKNVLGDKAPQNIEEFLKIKYNDVEKYLWLKKDYRVIKAIGNNNEILKNDKLTAKDLYYKFKDNGMYAGDHAIEQFIKRSRNGDFTFEKVKEIHDKPFNYIQNTSDGIRHICYYNKINVIKETNEFDKIVTIGKRKKESPKWVKNNETGIAKDI